MCPADKNPNEKQINQQKATWIKHFPSNLWSSAHRCEFWLCHWVVVWLHEDALPLRLNFLTFTIEITTSKCYYEITYLSSSQCLLQSQAHLKYKFSIFFLVFLWKLLHTTIFSLQSLGTVWPQYMERHIYLLQFIRCRRNSVWCWPSLPCWGNLTKAFILLIDHVHFELCLAAHRNSSPALTVSWMAGLDPKTPQQICSPALVAGSQASGPSASAMQLWLTGSRELELWCEDLLWLLEKKQQQQQQQQKPWAPLASSPAGLANADALQPRDPHRRVKQQVIDGFPN